jgi:nucleoside-diphosphate-sugar epimerase
LPEVTKCEQQWDYLYVDDAANAYYSQCLKACSGLYNLCSGNTVNLKSTIEMIQKILNDNSQISYGKVPYSKNQIMFLAGDCRRLKEQAGWTPRTSLAEGLKQTINYYRKLESN